MGKVIYKSLNSRESKSPNRNDCIFTGYGYVLRLSLTLEFDIWRWVLGLMHRLGVLNSCAKLFLNSSMHKRITFRTRIWTYISMVTLKLQVWHYIWSKKGVFRRNKSWCCKVLYSCAKKFQNRITSCLRE